MPRHNDRQRTIGALVHKCLTTFSRELRCVSTAAGMTPERLSALGWIDGHGPVSVGTLASLEGVRAATMSRMVAALVKDGLATRRKSEHDRRGVLVTATTKGTRTYQRATQDYHTRLGRALSENPELLTSIRDLASTLEQLGPTEKK